MTVANSDEVLDPGFVQARHGRAVIKIPIEQITHFKAAEKYVTAHHAGGELLLATPLIEIEALYGQRLVRIHRNALVARDRLELFRSPCNLRMTPAQVTLTDVLVPLDVSRRHMPAVRKAVNSKS
ncbi:LytTR family DNA-binding domain-containing protein [Pseudomonas sp. LJDD11]|uniref:LytTR family DNA-binding domain-containing protein n=1 Tax=Pseudomonas sp. LJDD11 TaxID=2931984 RepID=UPI00359CA1F3